LSTTTLLLLTTASSPWPDRRANDISGTSQPCQRISPISHAGALSTGVTGTLDIISATVALGSSTRSLPAWISTPRISSLLA